MTHIKLGSPSCRTYSRRRGQSEVHTCTKPSLQGCRNGWHTHGTPFQLHSLKKWLFGGQPLHDHRSSSNTEPWWIQGRGPCFLVVGHGLRRAYECFRQSSLGTPEPPSEETHTNSSSSPNNAKQSKSHVVLYGKAIAKYVYDNNSSSVVK